MADQYEIQWVPIDQIVLDINNPRIRKWVEIYGDNPTAEQLYLALNAGSGDLESSNSTTFSSLKQSILTNGGLINPIIVNKLPSGNLLVIEGNTRVAIYRSFKEEGAVGNWDHIPAIVHENLNPRIADAIRLQAHLVGPRPWDPYSKAKYLQSLRDVEHFPLSEIIDYCGGKKKEVTDYIEAYIDMEKYYRAVIPDDSAFDTTRFSAFVELQKPAIKQVIMAAGFGMEDFARWVHERLIDPLNTVRALPRILTNAAAKDKFLIDGAREALKLLDAPTTVSLSSVSTDQLLRAVIERVNQISFSEVKKLRADPSSASAQLFFESQEVIADLCKDINSDE